MQEETLVSSDQKTKLHVVQWQPKTQPIGIVQIIHGMAEYIERYHDFACYLNQLGYLVVGHDHLGHGQSVSETDPLYGYFGEESVDLVLTDIHKVRQFAQGLAPNVPYFMMGHSMGSFALRNYLQRHSQGVQGAILMGTGSKPVILSIALPFIKRLSEKDGEKVNPIIDTLAFGSFSKKFPEPSNFNWISKNQENVAQYEQDHLTGFVFTNNGFHTLFRLVEGANQKGWPQKIASKLPLLLVSGEQDPVGDFGKGPQRVAADLKGAGFSDVTVVLFPELRHEILLEKEKAEVYEVIGRWLKERNT